MSDGGSVLPQAEIDALFKQATGKSISPRVVGGVSASGETPRPPASPAAPSTKPPQEAEPAIPSSGPVQTAAPTPSDDVLQTIQATLDELARRMTKIETNISRLSQKEGSVADVSLPVQRLSQRLDAMVKDLQKVDSRVGGVLRGVEGTPGYGIRNDFTCESCGSRGFIALPMRCTKCGEDGWWGWWPKEK